MMAKGDRKLEQWARRATKGQQESAVFLNLWNDKMASDPLSEPQCVIQLGLALLLDKPIVVVAPHGAEIPINVQRAARSVKYYNRDDPQSVEDATRAALHEAGITPLM